MVADVVWHGTQREEELLRSAVAHHCTCEFKEIILVKMCIAHQMLTDQKALDQLLFGLRISHRLHREEWSYISRAL